MLVRHHELNRLDALDDIWDDAEEWFADLEETHTSQPSLVFFRSISHERSWVTAAGVVLDVAALRASTIDAPRNPRAELALRAGFLALRRIAALLRDPVRARTPRPLDPISITKEEFFEAYDAMVAEGVPVRADREDCWRALRRLAGQLRRRRCSASPASRWRRTPRGHRTARCARAARRSPG